MGIHSQITVKLEHPNYSICQFSQIRNTSRNPKHFSLTETLLTIRNSSRKPKHFSPPPGFEPGPHRTAVHCFIHQAVGYFLSYEVKKSKFKSLIMVRNPNKQDFPSLHWRESPNFWGFSTIPISSYCSKKRFYTNTWESKTIFIPRKFHI